MESKEQESVSVGPSTGTMKDTDDGSSEINETPRLPPGYDWLDELSDEDNDSDGDGDLAPAADNTQGRSYADTARTFKLRRNLDQLDSFHRQKELDVQTTSEELKLCHENIKSLEEQRETLELEIEQEEAAENSVAVFHLRTQHKNLCQRLCREEEVAGLISTRLRQLQLDLMEVEVDQGRCSSLRQLVQDEERLLQGLKAKQADTRLRQERQAVQNLQLKKQRLREGEATARRKEEEELRRKSEESRVIRRKAAQYLKQSLTRMRQQEAKGAEQHRRLLESRKQAVSSLKSNIAATQDNLRLQQSRAQANAQKKEQQHKELKDSLRARGINSTRHIYQQRQLESIRLKQEKFEEEHKCRKANMARVLREQQQARVRERNQSKTAAASAADELSSMERKRENLLHYLEPEPELAPEEEATSWFAETRGFSSSSSSSEDEELEEAPRRGVDHQHHADSLAQPEFSGMWDEKYKKPHNDKTPVKTTASLEEAAASRWKVNLSAGKEWKGPLFISRPEVILFKDFDVGKVYKKKILLTNISYTTNKCKLLGVSTQMKDFITINFRHPGSLPAGMSCDMQAVFHPKINEDLEGGVQFESAAGLFTVPVRCYTKKCKMEVDSQTVDFGSHVVGQTISRTITLSNKGALATLFCLDTAPLLGPESHHVQLPRDDPAHSQQESSSDLTPGLSQKSESDELSEDSPPEAQEQSGTDPEVTPESCVSTCPEEEPEDTGDITLGNVRHGEIGPFESISLDLVFTPSVPGEVTLDFHVKFSDRLSKPIPVHVRGVAVCIPVWLVRPNIDMRICLYDDTYQDIIVLQNRAITALKVTFEVCPEMRNHMDILPKSGLIQAQSSFKALLKFYPRRSLSVDASKYFDSGTCVLEVPVTVLVANQVQPVIFTVQAVVTPADVLLEPTDWDFGRCSVFHSYTKKLRLTNLSLRSQKFGFKGLTEFIEVQPGNGFGTLLPLETLEVDLIFKPDKAKEFKFQLTCKTEHNRTFLMSCQAVGVRPPMELSASLIKFRCTAVGDVSSFTVHLTYPQVSSKDAKQAAPPPETPRLFSFTLPEDAEISITPSAGRLLSGETCTLEVRFEPRLSEQTIRDEVQRLFLLLKEAEAKAKAELETKKEPEPGRGRRDRRNREATEDQNMEKIESADPADLLPGSELYEEAKAGLLTSFTQKHRKYIVPCSISDGDYTEGGGQAPPTWSPSNTLYLQLRCPSVRPSLLAVSKYAHNVIDFSRVAVGEKVIKKFTIQNISGESVDLRTSVLHPLGPFSILSALRPVKPGDKHTLVLAFTPQREAKYRETLKIQDQRMTLEVTLCGEAEVPVVTSSHPGGILHFDYVLEKESSSKVIKLENSCAVTVRYRALFASQSPLRPQALDDVLAEMLDDWLDAGVHTVVGTRNRNKQSVFTAVPAEGSIAPGESQDITVTFQPDHPSISYSDRVTIELINKSEACVLDLRGGATSSNLYLLGFDAIVPPIILPSPVAAQSQPPGPSVGVETLVRLSLRAPCSGSDGITPAVRELKVGYIRTPTPNRKGGEYVWDILPSVQQQGFIIEPVKGTVEVGTTRSVKVKWSPPSGYKPHDVVQEYVSLTLTGLEEKVVYCVLMTALVTYEGA